MRNDKELQIAICRIQHMEQCLDELLRAMSDDKCKASVHEDSRIRDMLQELTDYYDSGRWLQDYERDERGKLSEDLKRGVLAQDTLYNLLFDLRKQGVAKENKSMEYIKATEKDLDEIVELVQDTIRTIYPKYYPKEVVDFFCEHHCKENILRDIQEGTVGIIRKDNVIVGTGCYKDNHITRVYVRLEYQGQGYGSCIMQCLENTIAEKYDTVYLDASLPACRIYENRGYRTVKHDRWNVENGVVLVYEVMEKVVRG